MNFKEKQKITCSILCACGAIAMWMAMADGLLFIGVPVGSELKYGMAGLFAVVAALIPYVEQVKKD